MKIIKISKKMKTESVYYLQNHLTKKRTKPFSKKYRTYIKSLIDKKEKNIEKEAWGYVNSSQLNLGFIELVRDKKAKMVLTNDNKIDRNSGLKSVAELFLMMIEITNKGNDKGVGEILNAI